MINKFFQNTRKPEGILGRLMLGGMNSGHTSLADWGFTHIEFRSNMHILDIGCGGGANIARMLKECPEGHVDGLDYSQESVAVSQKKNQKDLGKRCTITRGDVSQLPFKSPQYDLITAFETIYFWPDLTNCFKNIRKALKHNGQFMITCEMSDPTNTMWTSKIQGMIVYTPEDLTQRLTQAGFTKIITDTTLKEWICLVAQP
ncbi:MAG: class I SAM-dependent methyltransferase [Lachnospiraceae bacterium]